MISMNRNSFFKYAKVVMVNKIMSTCSIEKKGKLKIITNWCNRMKRIDAIGLILLSFWINFLIRSVISNKAIFINTTWKTYLILIKVSLKKKINFPFFFLIFNFFFHFEFPKLYFRNDHQGKLSSMLAYKSLHTLSIILVCLLLSQYVLFIKYEILKICLHGCNNVDDDGNYLC